jgi:hypothetical protein
LPPPPAPRAAPAERRRRSAAATAGRFGLSPDHPPAASEEIDKAIESIKTLRKRVGKITLDELLSARHEGHKY